MIRARRVGATSCGLIGNGVRHRDRGAVVIGLAGVPDRIQHAGQSSQLVLRWLGRTCTLDIAHACPVGLAAFGAGKHASR